MNKKHMLTGSSHFHYIVKLEALRERRPRWLRQIITLILPHVKVLSHGSERLTPKVVLDHYRHHDLVMLPLLFIYFFFSF